MNRVDTGYLCHRESSEGDFCSKWNRQEDGESSPFLVARPGKPSTVKPPFSDLPSLPTRPGTLSLIPPPPEGYILVRIDPGVPIPYGAIPVPHQAIFDPRNFHPLQSRPSKPQGQRGSQTPETKNRFHGILRSGSVKAFIPTQEPQVTNREEKGTHRNIGEEGFYTSGADDEYTPPQSSQDSSVIINTIVGN
ncbi:hypothetical protein BABINDRAFT_152878 [Babjeviella inositovora NRRL Y-12698]|uniref:Uncharacterized protein n=1 Tax=Babjeviella inositovora NRRL Y-12698 TaxID=984486 RepID=A0A1E3QMC5_9ASCO|nr:uncharacterized protein BABINDRAFT_152878 [Babjeviella inositovora NRRL Y-12698]ODQ78768.1 hypothetical protein BABINDRAFT_152878 [Babjeviella inositovora NRRL Y-12698]